MVPGSSPKITTGVTNANSGTKRYFRFRQRLGAQAGSKRGWKKKHLIPPQSEEHPASEGDENKAPSVALQPEEEKDRASPGLPQADGELTPQEVEEKTSRLVVQNQKIQCLRLFRTPGLEWAVWQMCRTTSWFR